MTNVTPYVLPLFLFAVATGQPQAAASRLYVDRAHGEFVPPDPLAGLARHLNLELVNREDPISTASLQSCLVLYLRAPSKSFTGTEKEAIINFLRGGGSLLLVLDEEKRQSLEITGVNDLLVRLKCVSLRIPLRSQRGRNCKGGRDQSS